MHSSILYTKVNQRTMMSAVEEVVLSARQVILIITASIGGMGSLSKQIKFVKFNYQSLKNNHGVNYVCES